MIVIDEAVRTRQDAVFAVFRQWRNLVKAVRSFARSGTVLIFDQKIIDSAVLVMGRVHKKRASVSAILEVDTLF